MVMGVCGVAVALVAVSGARLAMSGHGRYGRPCATMLPGMTIDVPAGAGQPHRPVVTSLRSGGAAERGGARVGDALIAVDRLPLDSMAAVAGHLAHDRGRRVELLLEHDKTLRRVILDRTCGELNGPEDIGGRG